MSTSTNAGDKTRKEIPTKLGVSEEEINKDIANWAADRDSKGNIIPGTEGKTIAVMCGAPYFKDNVMEITDNDASGTASDTASSTGVTVIDEGEQGKTDLGIVQGPGVFIGTVEAKKEVKKEVKEDKTAEKDEK
jgi:hypothetical protein